MANVKIHCPNCHQEYDVDEAALGHEAECEACKKTFVLQADVPSEPPRRKTKMTVSVEKKTSLKHMKCEMCGGSDLVKQDGLFVCQHCGAKYTVEEARKMMVEGDGDVVVTGTVKIDDKERLENLYTLARREFKHKNYQESLKYYEAIIIEDPNNWEPLFTIGYIKTGEGEHNWGNVASEIMHFTRVLEESVNLIMASQDKDENEKIRLLDSFILVNSIKVGNAQMGGITRLLNIIKEQDSWNKENRDIYISNLNSIMLLYEKIADIAVQYIPNERSVVLRLWKIACENAPSGELQTRIALKIRELEPNYVKPPAKKIPAVRSIGGQLLIDAVIIVVGLAFFVSIILWLSN